MGGVVISRDPISNGLVENASMPDRTVVRGTRRILRHWDYSRWSSALECFQQCKTLEIVSRSHGIQYIQDIPQEDAATYRMLQKADSLGVFKSNPGTNVDAADSNACFMIWLSRSLLFGRTHSGRCVVYLRRKAGLEAINYPNEAIKSVLSRTLGVLCSREGNPPRHGCRRVYRRRSRLLRRAISNWGRTAARPSRTSSKKA